MGFPSCDCDLTLKYANCLISELVTANVFYVFHSDMFLAQNLWLLEIARGFHFEMVAYIDKICCFDCDATLLRRNLKQYYLRQPENKPPKFLSISTAANQSFFKNGSEKRTNSEIDKDEEQSSSQNCPNFKRSKN
ncbi:hypothetical protein AVEN_188442-1 [Araneus ventricosus]|uniref:Uncharacterized protein n=1 Tax=Araneus ventricosus TaxID=182803 RepID=A0A4Y2G1Y0_ARAVE|nr:hypothetical protein AVEN_188442-1 [Araneus ventricosus]